MDEKLNVLLPYFVPLTPRIKPTFNYNDTYKPVKAPKTVPMKKTKKRKITHLTEQQRRILLEAFAKSKYPGRDDKIS